jgi:hypothetical protein
MNAHGFAVICVVLTIAGAGSAHAEIVVTTARIGCLDIQTTPNLTTLVGEACNGKASCAYKAPTPAAYRAAGVTAKTRAFCTQAMEITYQCGQNDYHTVTVPGDAWDQPPAQLSCRAAPAPAPSRPQADVINVRAARIGCLDIQTTSNLTAMVGRTCDGKSACSFKAPTEAQYRAAGVKAATRTFCTQAMEITYDCGRNDPRSVFVPGDAWKHPPAALTCAAVPPPTSFNPGEGPIKITSARIGCLDIQTAGNLTSIVGQACNGRASCTYPAPTPDAYRKAGVVAATRTLCSQAMEIKFRCGTNDDQTITVPGDAWNRPPARLVCDGKTVATNRQDVTPPTVGSKAEPSCKPPVLAPPEYYIAPKGMLDWSPVPQADLAKIVKHHVYHPDLFQLLSGFIPPPLPSPSQYNTTQIPGSPGSTLGTHEGRLRAELREVAKKKDPLSALCKAAQRFTTNRPASKDTPADRDFGNAFADLSVAGKATFAAFVAARPDEAKLKASAACAGASDAAIRTALDRAYAVANALRKDHASADRRSLGWIAVSGEDDQPYRPVNVPSTKFPQFQIKVDVPRFGLGVHSRYMVAHRTAPAFAPAAAPLVNGGARKVAGDPAPAIAPEAEVILFIHGMDSRVEEAEQLTDALHRRPDGKNWTVISFDLPTSGYADNLHHGRISPIGQVACHNTPLLDFIEEYIVAFVDTVDRQTGGRLKPRIRAVVGGSLGGNMAMRLGRRPNTPWVTNVVPWSPAAIWPSKIAQRNAVAAGCDTGWDMLDDRAVDVSLTWGGKDPFFLPENELPAFRRTLFYGGFDWKPAFGLGGPPQAQCWFSDRWSCKQEALRAARLDRHETYDANFRAWHWRLAAEQLAFSQQQLADGTRQPLYLRNHKRMLLICGHEDTCGDLCKHTREVAAKMVNTPGYARFMQQTGHSLDNEYPTFIANEIATFLP